MGMAYAWEKMSRALDALATHPEPLPARLKYGFIPHFVNALRDGEVGKYMPPKLLERMQNVRQRMTAVSEPQQGQGSVDATVSKMTLDDGKVLVQEIIDIAHEVRRLSTF